MCNSKPDSNFDGEFDVIEINPNASAVDLIDMINQRFSQLQAMLAMTWGTSGEGFRLANEKHQADYMWLIDRTTHEARVLTTQLCDQHIKAKT